MPSENTSDQKDEESVCTNSVYEPSFSEQSDNDGDRNLYVQKLHDHGGFKLDLKDCNLAGGIAFITKFTRIFNKIQSIDFGKENLNKNEMAEFGEIIKVNKYI